MCISCSEIDNHDRRVYKVRYFDHTGRLRVSGGHTHESAIGTAKRIGAHSGNSRVEVVPTMEMFPRHTFDIL
jgi:hypothetical protein